MAISDHLAQEIHRRLREFCSRRSYVLNPVGAPLIDDLVNMHRLFGDYYCPCQPMPGPDTVCVCSAVRNGLVDSERACFCGLVLLSERGDSKEGTG